MPGLVCGSEKECGSTEFLFLCFCRISLSPPVLALPSWCSEMMLIKSLFYSSRVLRIGRPSGAFHINPLSPVWLCLACALKMMWFNLTCPFSTLLRRVLRICGTPVKQSGRRALLTQRGPLHSTLCSSSLFSQLLFSLLTEYILLSCISQCEYRGLVPLWNEKI
jgi:hypothetical protein